MERGIVTQIDMDKDWAKPYTDMTREEFKAWEREQLEIRYQGLVPLVREYARKKGYAIGVHGSLKRDLDLIAAPWTDWAVSPGELATGINKLVNGHHEINHMSEKPCGRVAFSIMLDSLEVEEKSLFGYIDLSVCPKK